MMCTLYITIYKIKHVPAISIFLAGIKCTCTQCFGKEYINGCSSGVQYKELCEIAEYTSLQMGSPILPVFDCFPEPLKYKHNFRLGKFSRCFCNHLYAKHNLKKLKNGRFGKNPCGEEVFIYYSIQICVPNSWYICALSQLLCTRGVSVVTTSTCTNYIVY